MKKVILLVLIGVLVLSCASGVFAQEKKFKVGYACISWSFPFMVAYQPLFVEELKNAGATQFGSGWVWLVSDKTRLQITKTANADTPLAHGQKALLTIDVWEHAYYLDYQNRRPDYLSAVIQNLINWDFVNANL